MTDIDQFQFWLPIAIGFAGGLLTGWLCWGYRRAAAAIGMQVKR